MNVDHHHSKYLHSIKIKEAAAATTTATATGGGGGAGAASFKVGRRRRVMSREVSNLSNSSVEGGGDYHAQEPAAVPFVWESSPGTPKRHTIMRLSVSRDDSPELSSSSSTKSSSRPSSSSSSSPSSQSCSVVSTPSPIHRHKSSFEYASVQLDEGEDDMVRSSGSPVSTLCFSRRLSCCNARFRGLYSNWF
ncbi:cell wall integrity and stress response component 1 isoform X1 [Spinacia oleracea]|uniref:Cell wall integrity and stress response component 1 isoform X1 n=1 Tax=Spinacia oleracea TaxID=3562 RepID=A0ABM3QWH6_SPIOL|nr:cell wall integrity and stress response component 1-like isoform X1 [Spinacia oleracea]